MNWLNILDGYAERFATGAVRIAKKGQHGPTIKSVATRFYHSESRIERFFEAGKVAAAKADPRLE